MARKKEKEEATIPRIDLHSQPGKLPFILKRRQLPIKLAFAMTINKAQGQSLDKVGISSPNRYSRTDKNTSRCHALQPYKTLWSMHAKQSSRAFNIVHKAIQKCLSPPILYIKKFYLLRTTTIIAIVRKCNF